MVGLLGRDLDYTVQHRETVRVPEEGVIVRLCLLSRRKWGKRQDPSPPRPRRRKPSLDARRRGSIRKEHRPSEGAPPQLAPMLVHREMEVECMKLSMELPSR